MAGSKRNSELLLVQYIHELLSDMLADSKSKREHVPQNIVKATSATPHKPTPRKRTASKVREEEEANPIKPTKTSEPPAKKARHSPSKGGDEVVKPAAAPKEYVTTSNGKQATLKQVQARERQSRKYTLAKELREEARNEGLPNREWKEWVQLAAAGMRMEEEEEKGRHADGGEEDEE